MKEEALALADLPSPLAETYEYWLAKDGPSLACGWADFHLQELPPSILPTTMVIDVFQDMELNRFRYWGSKMTGVHGMDMTGKNPYQIKPDTLAKRLRNGHANLMKNPIASASLFGFEHAMGFFHTHSVLRLPLSDDGTTLHQIIVATQFSDMPPKEWEDMVTLMNQ